MSDTRLDLTIDSVAYRGAGVARHDGQVVFVPGALPGEHVQADVTAKKKRFIQARVVEIQEASVDRIEPACPLSDRCPGCCYQHVSPAGELAIKQAQLLDFMTRQLKQDPAVCLAPVDSPVYERYRNKMTLHAEPGPKPKLGYRGFDNRTIVDIRDCPLVVHAISALLAERRGDANFMRSLGDHTDVTFRWTENDDARSWKSDNKSRAKTLTETTVLGDLSVPARSFFQVNGPVANLLVTSVQSLIRDMQPELAVDLYCGVGVFALAAATAGVENVLGVELDRAAVQAAERNAKRLHVPQVEFMQSAVSSIALDAMAPLEDVNGLLIVDPPRRGLHQQVLEAMCQHRPRNILYVSCAPDTLTRDLQGLIPAGYAVRQSQLFNMFPRTPYFEVVTWLSRLG